MRGIQGNKTTCSITVNVSGQDSPWRLVPPKMRGGVMPTRKHSEAQIIEALKQVEAGRTVADVGRELGVSKHTL
jgi:hypothetical protein